MRIAPGATVDGKYWVERVIGKGGMGVVVAATHLQLGQRVALKFLHGDSRQDPEAVARFLREARAAVRLRSEHVGRVLDVGTLDDGSPYIVMEFLEGEDLAAVLARRGPLAPALAVDLVLQACLALAEAHAARIVHRDLKPSNLFLTRRPDGSSLVKVVDFGIAKAHGTLNAELTASTAIMGSPGYMAPEQLKSSRDVDARADLWSLGVVLYELITGRRPYVAESVTAMAVKIATEDPPPLPPSVPRPLAAAILRCLAREPDRRFADVAALAAALAPAGGPAASGLAASVARVLGAGDGGRGARPAARALMDAPTRSRRSGTGSTVTAPWLPRRGAFWIGIAAGTVAVALVVIIAVALGRGHGAAPAGPVDAASSVVIEPLVAPTVDAGPVDAGTGGATSAPPLDGGPRPRPAVLDARPRPEPVDAARPSPTPVDARPTAIDAPAPRVPGCVPTPDDTNCDGIPDRR